MQDMDEKDLLNAQCAYETNVVNAYMYIIQGPYVDQIFMHQYNIFQIE